MAHISEASYTAASLATRAPRADDGINRTALYLRHEYEIARDVQRRRGKTAREKERREVLAKLKILAHVPDGSCSPLSQLPEMARLGLIFQLSNQDVCRLAFAGSPFHLFFPLDRALNHARNNCARDSARSSS